jgi:hypothetical protein
MSTTELTPVPSDAIQAYAWHSGRIPSITFGAAMAKLHARSLTSYPTLAMLFRSSDALDDVGAAAAQHAHPQHHLETHAAAGARAASIARTAYQSVITRQLADAPGHELGAAARALVAADDLAQRLAAAKQRHEEHARIAAEVAIAEQRAAERAAQEARDAEEDAQALAIELARIGAQADDERRRIGIVVQLRRRLRSTTATRLQVGTSVYAPRDLAAGVRDFSIDRCTAYLEALDRAESELAP